MEKWKRIVIKVGTTTLTHKSGRLNIRRVEQLAKVICDIANSGIEIIFVSSGAISMGVGKMGLPGKPSDMAGKQACAAVGQCELMYTYDKLFSEYNRTIAQVLLTGEDLSTPGRVDNFTNTMNRLLELGVIPVLNENDTIATDEITSIGDNDTLASAVATSCKADLLILFSDIDGVYTVTIPKRDLIVNSSTGKVISGLVAGDKYDTTTEKVTSSSGEDRTDCYNIIKR